MFHISALLKLNAKKRLLSRKRRKKFAKADNDSDSSVIKLRHVGKFSLILTYYFIYYFLENFFGQTLKRTVVVTLQDLMGYFTANAVLNCEYNVFKAAVEHDLEEEMDGLAIDLDIYFNCLYCCVTFKHIYFFSSLLEYLLGDDYFHSTTFSEIVDMFECIVELKREEDSGYKFLLKGKFDRHGRKKYKMVDGGNVMSSCLNLETIYTKYILNCPYGVFSIQFWLV